jgi:hypothetical protein
MRRALTGAGFALHETDVGDRFVMLAMEEHDVSLGGEQSGHIILRELTPTGDGLASGLVLAEIVARRGPLAQLADEAWTRTPQRLLNVPVQKFGEDAVTVAYASMRSAFTLSDDDVRLLVRRSGTEPVVRVMMEATNADAGELLHGGSVAGLRRRGAGLLVRAGVDCTLMCGIIGVVGATDALPILLEGLERLEYRGYDSAGVALQGDGLWRARTAEGTESVAALIKACDGAPRTSSAGIGHTRWATHGAPGESNAHPHLDCAGQVAVIHNGIIENHAELAEELRGRGHEFTSVTDTEVLAHASKSGATRATRWKSRCAPRCAKSAEPLPWP